MTSHNKRCIVCQHVFLITLTYTFQKPNKNSHGGKNLKQQENLLQRKGKIRNNLQPHRRGQVYFFCFCFCLHPNISPPFASFLLIYNLRRETSDPWYIIDTVSHIHLALCRKINRSVLPLEFVVLYCLIISDCEGFEEINSYGF